MLREEVELCPYCSSENILQWDVEKNGYETKCQHCGKEMMLCDACYHSEDNENQFCDFSSKGCWRSRMVNIIVYRDTVNPYHKEDDNLISLRTFEWCVRNYIREKCCESDYSVWINQYTADDTLDFYHYIQEHGYMYKIIGD